MEFLNNLTMKSRNNSRRDFLKKGVLAAAIGSVLPLAATAKDNRKTVKMLTPEGTLVEVSEDVIAKANKKRVTNKDILEWRGIKG